MHRGYIKLWRKVEDSTIFADSHLLQLAVWCLVKAIHKKQTVRLELGNTHKLISLSPGQLIFNREKVAKELSCKPASTRKRMLRLESPEVGFVTTEKHRLFWLVTICNWVDYQPVDEGDITTEGNDRVTTGERPSNDREKQSNDRAALGSRLKTQAKSKGVTTLLKNVENVKNREDKIGAAAQTSIFALPKSDNPKPVAPKEKKAPKKAEYYFEWFQKLTKQYKVPVPKKLTEKRRESINARIAGGLTLKVLDEIEQEMPRSRFLRGEGGNKNWEGINFDFLFIRRDNWLKTIEGKYRDKDVKSDTPKPHQTATNASHQW